MKLKNKIAIVTGASRGLGKACALELAKEGANVVIDYVSSGPKAEAVVKQIKKLGRKSIAIQADVSKTEDATKLIKETIKKFGRIDILVNNAGIYKAAPADKTGDDLWNATININLKGEFNCTREAIKYMKKAKSGKIVNISSIAGLVGFSDSAAYCASKGGVAAMTKELALELAPFNINVNAICPGVMKTDMTKDMLNDKKTLQMFKANIPLQGPGEPADIGKAAAFLASQDAKYITGHLLVVDGGWTCH